MMTNKIFHKDLLNPHVFLFNLSVVVLVWLKITAATSLDHQLVAVAAGEGGLNSKCIDKEREALLDFKAHLDQIIGQVSTWKPEEDEDCCKWRGVTCNNHTGHIIQLKLSGNKFNGTIPMSIGSLSKLRHLDLSDNRFNGTFPMSIGSLTELRHLDLSMNRFNGRFPMSIGSLTELRYLYLGFNSFSGNIPKSIGSLKKLRYLFLGYNSFSGNIPRSIGSLTELRDLDLSRNSLLNGAIPTELGNLTNLENLSLNYLESCIIENLDWLSHLSQLQYLSMSGTSLAKANHWINVITRLRKLSELYLYDCDLSQVMHPYSSYLNSSSSSSIVHLSLGGNNLNSSMYHWLFPLISNKLQMLDLSENKLDGIPKYLGNLCSLEVLYLTNNSVVVEFPDFLNNLSGCTSATLKELLVQFSQFTGSLPDEIQMFSSLEILNLNNNQLNGTISEKVWELPNLILLDISSNYLKGAISEKIGKSKLIGIFLSNNSFQEVPPKAHMSNSSYIEYIDLSSCKQLGPRFPKWIESFKYLSCLDISNTGISDTIPVEFWNMWPSQLTHLNLASNNISGMVPHVSSRLVTLDLSKNKFSGEISFLCHIIDGNLSYLDLSNNAFTGQIPNCLWNFKNLKVLNLGYNNLSGSLPPSIGSLIKVEVLYINNNLFSGELPLSLKNCTNLNFLYLGNNRFSSNVPFWIGENLLGLYALSLTSNNFFGTIPPQLCQLVNLQILDLSMNNINGTIPSCVTNLTAVVQHGFSLNLNRHYYDNGIDDSDDDSDEYLDHAMIKWQGSVREFMSTLGLVKSIDLSSNNLTGQIPYELINLHELLTLNLSNNALLGNIPEQIGQMKKLLALDLSRNNLSGGIPSSISLLTLLCYLDVSYNNLSGRIPLSTQMQTFEPSRYIGNVGLCGRPLTIICLEDKLEVPPSTLEIKDDGEGIDKIKIWFYIGGATGFSFGFWLVCSGILLTAKEDMLFLDF